MVHPELKPSFYPVTIICHYCEWGVVVVDLGVLAARVRAIMPGSEFNYFFH
jgi:hypothetical protein